jgi:excisionase family DNA binding protein
MALVTIKDIAKYLSVKEPTLYSWVHSGLIPFHKLNGLIRFDMDEIESWVKSSKKMSNCPSMILKKAMNQDVDKIVKKAIDSARSNGYNLSNGKPGQHQGLRKEA